MATAALDDDAAWDLCTELDEKVLEAVKILVETYNYDRPALETLIEQAFDEVGRAEGRA